MTVKTEFGLRTYVASAPEQVMALGDPTRARILQALRWQPASAKRLSEHLEMTHGRVGHHLKLLESFGLVEVAEERQVRAMTERVYRTTFDFITVDMDDPKFQEIRFFFQFCSHLVTGATPHQIATARRLNLSRMSEERALAYAERLRDLAEEFASHDDPDGDVYALAGAVFSPDQIAQT